jgi:hypothetical protein
MWIFFCLFAKRHHISKLSNIMKAPQSTGAAAARWDFRLACRKSQHIQAL